MDEWVEEIWGEFIELLPINDYTGRRQRGDIVCRRCGAPAISEAGEKVNAYLAHTLEEQWVCEGAVTLAEKAVDAL
jgi:hypothetical protein